MTLQKLRELVQKEAGERAWNLHMVPVVRYARHLAKAEGIDEELAEIAALLHDIGRFRIGKEDHEITGVKEAEKILRELKYPDKLIDEVKHCVLTHRASKSNSPKTKLAEIIRDADALSHFDIVPRLIQAGLKENDDDLKKAIEWVGAKLDRDWNNKMHLPESKRLVEEKYKAAKLLLHANLELFPKK
jgi:uncharacterized protein